MKKEEIQKELSELQPIFEQDVRSFFRPLVRIFSVINRIEYLQHELQKVTPRPQAPTNEKEVKSNVLEIQKENPQGA